VERECSFTDGYIDLNDDECKNCASNAKNICKIFSIHKGFRSEEYFLDNDRTAEAKVPSSFISRIKGVKK
jgi:hypothetical protein